MRDVTGKAFQRVSRAADGLRGYLTGNGYEVIDTPLLEETELFVRKSGGELTSRLYTFIDPGGHRVSLRPELTSSVIRHFIEEGDSGALPVRSQYSGPVFRYEHGEERAFRQFTQAGAELIGDGGIDTDAEMLSLAWEGLREMGVRRCQVNVGHIGVLHEILTDCGLSEPAKLFMIGNVQALKNGSTDTVTMTQQAEDIGLLKTGPQVASRQDMTRAGKEITADFVQNVVSEAMSSPIGRRTADQIVERLLRKAQQADGRDKLEGAMSLLGDLARVEGNPSTAIGHALDIVAAHGVKTSAIDNLGRLVDAIAERGIGDSDLVLDLGLARGISYYTGVIFEFTYPSSSGRISLGGGGRYDSLVKALGGDDVPALGFAFVLERVAEAAATAATSSVAKEKRASSLGS
jgi:histidyl-tRNA synthetase